MNNFELESKLKSLIKTERQITSEILKLISLADERKLYLERGYSSMFDWLTKFYSYSAASAYRRIQAAKLLKELPSIENKIESGELNLSTLAKTQSIIQWQEKKSGETINLNVKSNIIGQIEKKSTIDAEKTLYQLFPELSKEASFQERATVISDTVTKLTISMSYESLRNLEKARDILSHKLPQGTLTDVVVYLVNEFLQKKDPVGKEKAARTSPPQTTNISSYPQQSGRTKVKEAVRRFVLQKAKGKCQFIDMETGQVCESTYQLEVDHIYPVALGGKNNLENLRCLCRKHNQYVAQNVFNLRAPPT